MSSDTVLSFWFGSTDPWSRPADEVAKRWWQKSDALDEEIRKRFRSDHQALTAGQCTEWLSTPAGRLAAVIVLDQFSRNMFRDAPEMFASDAQALRLARDAVHRGCDQSVGPDWRSFFYLPFMHSEALADQDFCVAMFELLAKIDERFDNGLDYARKHRDIILRFGRFPHRSKLLGRVSSPEEVQFLTQPGSSF